MNRRITWRDLEVPVMNRRITWTDLADWIEDHINNYRLDGNEPVNATSFTWEMPYGELVSLKLPDHAENHDPRTTQGE